MSFAPKISTRAGIGRQYKLKSRRETGCQAGAHKGYQTFLDGLTQGLEDIGTKFRRLIEK